MIILLPTYKRTQILSCVISSILNCDVVGIDERILILVVNNNFNDRSIINDIIENTQINYPFSCKVIHQEKKMVAVESWFQVIFENAYENEIIVMNGDDDIVLPQKLIDAVYSFSSSGADMIVTDYYQRLYFSKNCKKFVVLGDDFKQFNDNNLRLIDFDFSPDHVLPASFVSAHIYKNTEAFKKGYHQAIYWCKTQEWAPWSFASGLLPTWLSFAINSQGGKVCKLQKKTVLRGQLTEELLKQEYSDGGSTVFYSILYYQMFNSQSLHKNSNLLRLNSDVCMNSIKSRILDFMFTKSVNRIVKQNALKNSQLSFFRLIFNSLFISGTIKYVLSKLPLVKGYKVRYSILFKSKSLSELTEFVKTL